MKRAESGILHLQGSSVTMPVYEEYFELSKRKQKEYKDYQKAIDGINGQLKEPISRNGVDHFVWYAFSGKS